MGRGQEVADDKIVQLYDARMNPQSRECTALPLVNLAAPRIRRVSTRQPPIVHSTRVSYTERAWGASFVSKETN